MFSEVAEIPSLKELEESLFRMLQETFKKLMVEVLEKIDEQITASRDKKRFRHFGRREVKMDTTFGAIIINRTYFKDRETGNYVALLDKYMEFHGSQGFSPLLEKWAVEMAIEGRSYRNAAQTLERFLGYQVISHESIRQIVAQSEVQNKKEKEQGKRVLFVEVDGL